MTWCTLYLQLIGILMSYKNKILNIQALTRGDFRLETIDKVETVKVVYCLSMHLVV